MIAISTRAKRMKYQIITMRECVATLDRKIADIEAGRDDGKLLPHVEYRKSVIKSLAAKEGEFAIETETAVGGMYFNSLLAMETP